MLYRSTGDGLQRIEQHYGVITNNAASGPDWVLRKNDQLFIGDFNGNGQPDIALFNGTDWAAPVLGIFTREASGFTLRQRYAGSVFNFDLSPHDQISVMDVNNDGRDDIIIFNTQDWEQGVLATLRTQPNLALHPSWQTGHIGAWIFMPGDEVQPFSYTADPAVGLLIYRQNSIALLRSEQTRFSLESIFPGYIKDYRYHGLGYY